MSSRRDLLFLRLHAECPADALVAPLQQRLRAALAPWSPQWHGPPQRYWKIESMFQFELTLHPPTRTTFHAVRALDREGWCAAQDEGVPEIVWNRRGGGVLFLPEVRWASLELLPR